MQVEFKPYGSTPRLFRDMVITEKIDGTNAGIGIQWAELGESLRYDNLTEVVLDAGSEHPETGMPSHEYIVWAQSRNRIITPGNDNAGFAGWVADNAQGLVDLLGPGMHFGEWFGQGIQGNPYQLDRKEFALFNVHRWGDVDFAAEGFEDVRAVPFLYSGPYSEDVIRNEVSMLRNYGSRVSDGARAEGVVVYHTAARQVFKVLCESDELPKSVRDAA